MWFFSSHYNYCGGFFQHCQRKKSGEERKNKIFPYSYTVSLINNFTAAFICKYFMLLNTYLHIIHSKKPKKKSRKKEWGRKKNLQVHIIPFKKKSPETKNNSGRKEKPAVLLKDLYLQNTSTRFFFLERKAYTAF